MTMAATLTEAAYLTYEQCGILWTANTLRNKYEAFLEDVSPIFSDSQPNDRPVGNWLIPMYALLTQVEAATPEEQVFLNTCVQYIYRICYAGYIMNSDGFISNTQATQLLAAWNANIGT